jgi:arginase
MGRGPLHLLRHGLAERLSAGGREVRVAVVEADDALPPAEIRTAFELAGRVADAVRSAVARGDFPLVLAGNCNTALGTVAGLGHPSAVVWFDAHADFNTPETTVSGFLDGMALATLTGRCWTRAASAIPGHRPVADVDVALVGARDLDEGERDLLSASAVRLVPPGVVRTRGARAALTEALDGPARRGRPAYVHVDLDVLDPAEARANALAAADGLSVDELCAAIHAVAERCPIAAAALTAYDPAADEGDRVGDAAGRVAEAILAADR